MSTSGTSSFQPSSQWENLLHHLGAWEGSFTRLSAQGQPEEDTPTVVTLEGLDENRRMQQTIQYFSAVTGEKSQEKVLEYESLNRSVLFHANGAFSLGSMQHGPLAEFGAEFGFVEPSSKALPGDRRLRLVILFNPEGHLSSFTLIREQRVGTTAPERPPLTVEQLLGTWQGEAVTLYPDWRSADTYPTTLVLQQQGEHLSQRLTAPNLELTSTATIAGSQLLFSQGTYPIQVLLLPDGASCTAPLTIPRGQPFFLEVGWLLQENLRQRLIRSYDAQGGWASLTLVTEYKIDNLTS